MSEQDIIGLIAGFFLVAMVGGVGAVVVLFEPIDRWLKKMQKRRAKPA